MQTRGIFSTTHAVWIENFKDFLRKNKKHFSAISTPFFPIFCVPPEVIQLLTMSSVVLLSTASLFLLIVDYARNASCQQIVSKASAQYFHESTATDQGCSASLNCSRRDGSHSLTMSRNETMKLFSLEQTNGSCIIKKKPSFAHLEGTTAMWWNSTSVKRVEDEGGGKKFSSLISMFKFISTTSHIHYAIDFYFIGILNCWIITSMTAQSKWCVLKNIAYRCCWKLMEFCLCSTFEHIFFISLLVFSISDWSAFLARWKRVTK